MHRQTEAKEGTTASLTPLGFEAIPVQGGAAENPFRPSGAPEYDLEVLSQPSRVLHGIRARGILGVEVRKR
jgi:hypothetical protein